MGYQTAEIAKRMMASGGRLTNEYGMPVFDDATTEDHVTMAATLCRAPSVVLVDRQYGLSPLAVGPCAAHGLEAANDNRRMPDVVGICGLAGSGKSTAADYLVNSYGYVRVKFATPLKSMMRVLGLSDAQIEGDLKEVPAAILCGRTPRWAMQTLGSQWGRDLIHPDLWTSLWARTARDVLEHGGKVVCDDYRFPNEAETLRQFGGVLLKMTGRGGIAGGHQSEGQELPHDRVIDNTGDMYWLQQQLGEVVNAAA